MEINHGKVGEALYLKFTVDKFNQCFKDPQNIKDGDIFSVEECDKRFNGFYAFIPIHIDNTTQGNYECVCEFGTEIH